MESKFTVGVASYPEQYYEWKFKSIIDKLGSYKIKACESYLMYTYFKIKLTCETNRFAYQTVVCGDEFDDKAVAQESAYRKAYGVLINTYKKDLEEIGKLQRRQLGKGQKERDCSQ